MRGPDAPTFKAFGALDAEGKESLKRDPIDLNGRHDRSSDEGIVRLPEGDGNQKVLHDFGQFSEGKQSTLSWRWNNIPLPEPHMVGILASVMLHHARPWRLPGSKRLYLGAGWTLVGAGVAVSASAVRAASGVDLDRPSTLTSSGPYAISRNPMYGGWTLLHLGAALIMRNAWMIASLPVVARFIHQTVLQEERTLEQAFGEEYLRYRKLVRRYL